jgi:type I restriction enzyme, S subunit
MSSSTSHCLPDGWEWAKLGEICEIASGVTLGRKLTGAETRPVPYLRVANVKDGYLDLADVYEFEATAGEVAKCRLCHGDLLLTEGGDKDKLGRGTVWEEQLPECIHQNHIFRARFDLQQFSPFFVSAQLGSPYGKAYFLAHAKQTTGIATINQGVLKAFPLMVPSLPEQKRIAAILTEQMAQVEKARAAAEAQLAAAQALPAAYLRDVFDSEQARRWPEKSLADVASIQLGKMLSPASKTGRSSFPYLRNLNVQWGRFDLADVAEMDFNERERTKFELWPGDLLVCEGGEPGRAAVWHSEIKPCYYQKALHCLRAKDAQVDPRFLMYRLWLGAERGEFLDSNAQTTIAHLPAVRLAELRIRTPAVADQVQVAQALDTRFAAANRTCTELRGRLGEINKLPAALLRQAFRGEL